MEICPTHKRDHADLSVSPKDHADPIEITQISPMGSRRSHVRSQISCREDPADPLEITQISQ